MQRCRGTQFDPKFVDILLKLINDGTIDLNKIYHVPKEESDQAEREAAIAREEKERQRDEAPVSPGSYAEIKTTEQGGKA